jgi:hypothetical protein
VSNWKKGENKLFISEINELQLIFQDLCVGAARFRTIYSFNYFSDPFWKFLFWSVLYNHTGDRFLQGLTIAATCALDLRG